MKENINKYSKPKKNMKRIGVVFGILMLMTLVNFSFVLAVNTTNNTSSNVTANVTINVSSNVTVSNNNSIINLSALPKAIACLETQVKDDCSGAVDIQQIALTILASPKQSVAQGCYNKLKTYDKGNCFGLDSCQIRDTAMAVLALSHLNQDTKKYTDWMLNQTLISADVLWFMQQDSLEPANCKVIYDAQEYLFSVQANKKIDVNAGACLSLTNSNYWYSIDSNCYDKSFALICDKDFVGNLLYKQPNSPTIYVLSNTQSAGASGTINLQVKSKCFGQGTCNYEASAWAALALQTRGINVDEFIPYLVASLENNKPYLPYAFLNMLVDYSEYGTKLVQMQNLNSWEAENTAYNQFYDTAIALVSLSDSSATQVKGAKDWLLGYAQSADGCWNNKNVRDTAAILWALQQKPSNFFPGGGPALTTCSEGNFFCVKTSECDTNQLKQNYGGCGTGRTCCGTNALKTCTEYYGQVCASGKVCSGDSRAASDSSFCCLAECGDAVPQTSQCELGGGICKDSCSTTQTETAASCGASSNQVCCERKTTPEKKSLWWLWLLLIILIILIALAIIFRDKIKIWLYKRKSGFKKDEGNNSGMGGPTRPMGPGPGMMPPQQQRPMMRPQMMPGQAPPGMQRRPLPQQMPNRFPPRV